MVLVLVDPALRHLPGVVRIIDPGADPDLAVAVQQHHADPAAVESVVVHRTPSSRP